MKGGQAGGYSLAEVLLATFLLAVALMSLVTAQAYAARARALNERHLVAAQFAASALAALEQEAQTEFDTLASRPETPLAEGMLLSVQILPEPSGSPNLKLARATVHYRSANDPRGGRAIAETLLYRP